MAFGRFRIHDKIVTPFVLLALVATVGAAWIALSLSSRAIESRVESQIARGSALVSQSHFALSPSILELVKEIANADVVTYSADGKVLASTIEGERRQPLARAVIDTDATAEALRSREGATIVRQLMLDEVTYAVAYRTVPARPGTVVAFVADTSELVSSTRQARTRILFAAGITLLVLVVASQLIARRVTAPLEALVAFTREAGQGGSPRRAKVQGDDETARLAAAFNQMLDRLQTSQEALVRSEKLAVTGLLAARVAHDVRNPLSSIKMQTQLLRSRLRGDSSSQTVLASILRDIEQVESVVRGLLELARPGTLALRPTPLNAVVEDVLRQVAPQMAHRKITLEPRLSPTLPDIALDAERFRQALLNVVNNAADAMPDGGTLTIVTSPGPGSTVLLDVCDDGTGIDPSVAHRVFDPFVSTKRDGVGLGLVNTKSVVESHGGTVELEPREAGGTRARITLPAPALAAGSDGSA